ncbi:MAG: DNA primase [Leptospiraceae bacterium]|nr:DNA primase [Leptospiraceae bacterium]MDW7976475.1 DNA primase [Leptospiraceae bacterium]
MYDLKEKLLTAIPIESYVGRFVSLKKQGRYLVGLCPFHREKTPSFTITPEKGIFYCFGCGKGGNLITFVMEKEQVSFKEALQILCEYAGIPFTEKEITQENQSIKLMEKVSFEYHKFLLSEEGKPYRDYLHQRGILDSTITKFQLGAAPNTSQFLLHLFPEETQGLLSLGLIKKNEWNQFYDFFRNRVIFPISNTTNQVVGFGGRVIDDSKPKYLNSPESAIFHKGSTLFGLSFAIESIKRRNEVLITEGYLDVLGLHQVDLENVVAPLGTAFTENHKRLLHRYTKNVVIMMDGDVSGRNAVLKTLFLFQDDIEKTHVILLPEGMDPFDLSVKILNQELYWIPSFWKEFQISGFQFLLFSVLVSSEGVNRLFPVFENDIEIWQRELQKIFSNQQLQRYYKNLTLSEKQSVLSRFEEIYSHIHHDILQQFLKEELQFITGLNFLKHTNQDKTKFFSQTQQKKVHPEIDQKKNILFFIERDIIGTLLKFPKMVKTFSNQIQAIEFEDEASFFLWNILHERTVISGEEIDPKVIFSYLPQDVQRIFAPYLLEQKSKIQSSHLYPKDILSDEDMENILRELITKHRLEKINQQIQEKQERLRLVEPDLKAQLYYEINELIREKKILLNTLKAT